MRGFEMKGAWFGKIEFAFTHNLSFYKDYNMMSYYSYEYWMSMTIDLTIQICIRDKLLSRFNRNCAFECTFLEYLYILAMHCISHCFLNYAVHFYHWPTKKKVIRRSFELKLYLPTRVHDHKNEIKKNNCYGKAAIRFSSTKYV